MRAKDYDGDPHIPKKILRCEECGSTSFYRSGGQWHSDPPWEVFGCWQCQHLWAVNCRWIYSHYNKTVIYDARGHVLGDGKPHSFTDKDGKEWRMGYPPGFPPRTEAEYAEYRKPNNSGPAVGVYEVFHI